MSDRKDYEPPKRTAGDLVHNGAHVIVSSIPLAGAAVGKLLNLLLTPPLERRRDEWMTDVGEALRKLEAEKNINLEELRENEGFIDTVMTATRSAMRTSQRKKKMLFGM